MSDDSKKDNNIEEQISRISNNFESDILRLIKTQSLIKTSGGIIDEEIDYLKSKTEQIQEKLKELNLKTNELNDLLQVNFQDMDLSNTHVGIYINEFIAAITSESNEISSLNKELTDRLSAGSDKLTSLHKFYTAELEAFQQEVDSGLNILREDIKGKLDAELEEEIKPEVPEQPAEPPAEQEENPVNDEEYYQSMFASSESPGGKDTSDDRFLYIALGILVLIIAGVFGYYFKYIRPVSSGDMVIIEELYNRDKETAEVKTGKAELQENVSDKVNTAEKGTGSEINIRPEPTGNPGEYILSELSVIETEEGNELVKSEVLVKRANVRSGPGKGYGVVGVITYGTVVELLNENSGIWTKVRFQDGNEGWVAKKLLSK